MKLRSLLLLLAPVLLLTYSCDDEECDCKSGVDFAFHVVDPNQKDLVLGESPRYNSDTVRVFAQRPDEPLDKTIRFDPGGVPYLHVPIPFGQPGRYFLYLNNEDTDTLEINFDVNNSDCCPAISNYEITYNGQPVCTNCNESERAFLYKQ